MNVKEIKSDLLFDQQTALPHDERSGWDRRKVPSQGYAYVSMVGWICRREHPRRCDDDDEP